MFLSKNLSNKIRKVSKLFFVLVFIFSLSSCDDQAVKFTKIEEKEDSLEENNVYKLRIGDENLEDDETVFSQISVSYKINNLEKDSILEVSLNAFKDGKVENLFLINLDVSNSDILYFDFTNKKLDIYKIKTGRDIKVCDCIYTSSVKSKKASTIDWAEDFSLDYDKEQLLFTYLTTDKNKLAGANLKDGSIKDYLKENPGVDGVYLKIALRESKQN